jgi:ubiquinone/menaquinone biosynthesis C-methylase UbiE
VPGPASASTGRSPNLGAVAMCEEAVPRYDRSGAQLAGPIADRLVNLARLRPGDQVLDIGCGAGTVTLRSTRAVSPGGHCAIACWPPESHDTGKAAVQ